MRSLNKYLWRLLLPEILERTTIRTNQRPSLQVIHRVQLARLPSNHLALSDNLRPTLWQQLTENQTRLLRSIPQECPLRQTPSAGIQVRVGTTTLSMNLGHKGGLLHPRDLVPTNRYRSIHLYPPLRRIYLLKGLRLRLCSKMLVVLRLSLQLAEACPVLNLVHHLRVSQMNHRPSSFRHPHPCPQLCTIQTLVSRILSLMR